MNLYVYAQDLISGTVIDKVTDFNMDPPADVAVDINTNIILHHHTNILPNVLNPHAQPFVPKFAILLNEHPVYTNAIDPGCDQYSFPKIFSISPLLQSKNNGHLSVGCVPDDILASPDSVICDTPNLSENNDQLSPDCLTCDTPNLSENNDQLSPDCFACVTPNLSETNDELCPDCFTCDTPNLHKNNGQSYPNCDTSNIPNPLQIDKCFYFSECNVYCKGIEKLSLSHCSNEESQKSALNPEALAFVSRRIENDIPREIYNDQDSPYSILKDLRLRNVDKIIIGHININSIRNKFVLLADLIKR